jgi:signal transduction histidine kinase
MPSAADSSPDSFAGHCVTVNGARLRIVICILLLIVLVAGPIQSLLLRPQAALAQRVWMLGVLATLLVAAMAFHVSTTLRRHADLLCAGLVSASVGLQARGLSQLGGLETLYVGIACVGPMIAVLFLVPLGRRILLAVAPPLAFYGVFFALRPGAMHHPFAGVPVFHAFLAVSFAVVFGELNFRLAREHHAQRTLLEGERARLDAAVRTRAAEVLELARNLVSLEESERTRIARELHDELGQQLTGARLEAAGLAEDTRVALGDDAPAARRATGIEARLAVAQQAVRDVVFSLRPPALDDFDLGTALRVLVDRYRRPNALEVAYQNTLEGMPLTDTQATTVFRVLQEALTNVTRHAGATRVDVRLGVEGGDVVLVVADDGRGPAPTPRIGFGLRGIRERLQLVDGDVVLTRGDAGGAVLRATFRLAPEQLRSAPRVSKEFDTACHRLATDDLRRVS